MNSCIVVTAYTEGALSKHLAIFNIGIRTLLVKDVEQYSILSLARNDNNILEVLCSGTDEEIPPISIFSMMSASEAPLATVCSKG